MLAVELAFFAVLAVLCLVGWRVEGARVDAWQGNPKTGQPKSVRRLFAVGAAPWVRLGNSEEQSFETVSANPTLTSAGFELRSEDGETLKVPIGVKVQVRSIDGARRVPLEAITSGGAVRPRFTFEVPPDLALFTTHKQRERALVAYRSSAAVLDITGGQPLVLTSSPGSLIAGAYPGCWLMILVPFVIGGALSAWLVGPPAALTAGLTALVLMLIGWAALPERPPA